MISQKQKSSFKQKLKTGFQTTVIASLILTESILISCERCNNNNDKGVNMSPRLIETEEIKVNENLNMVPSFPKEKLSLTDKFVSVPNTNLFAKTEGDKVFIKEGDKIYSLDNKKNLEHIFEHDGNIYLTGIKDGFLHFSSYDKTSLEENKGTDFSYQFLSQNEKLKSYSFSINSEGDFLEIKGTKSVLGSEKESNVYFRLRLDSLKTRTNFTKNREE